MVVKAMQNAKLQQAIMVERANFAGFSHAGAENEVCRHDEPQYG
jgi:hypothetical protein